MFRRLGLLASSNLWAYARDVVGARSSSSPPTRRVVRVIELLAAAEEPMNVTAIANTLDLPRTTVDLVVRELCAAGWVFHQADGGYALVGVPVAGSAIDLTYATYLLDRLAEDTDGLAVLYRIETTHYQSIAVGVGSNVLGLRFRAGLRAPLIWPGGASVMPWRQHLDTWLESAPEADHDAALELVDSVRAVGVVVHMGRHGAGPALELFRHMAAQTREDCSGEIGSRGLREVYRKMLDTVSNPYTRAQLSSQDRFPIVSISAPVRDATGVPMHQVTLHLFRDAVPATERGQLIRRTKAAARHLSVAVAQRAAHLSAE